MRLENAPARPRAQRCLQSFGQGANPLMAVVRAGREPCDHTCPKLNNDLKPALGLGVLRLRPRRLRHGGRALRVGYRHVDRHLRRRSSKFALWTRTLYVDIWAHSPSVRAAAPRAKHW